MFWNQLGRASASVSATTKQRQMPDTTSKNNMFDRKNAAIPMGGGDLGEVELHPAVFG